MVFRVDADSFGSDPDIFISRVNEYPSSPSNSDWYCNKKGSELCIIPYGDFEIGETFYFGISCLIECSYQIHISYAETIEPVKDERQQFVFDAFSTKIVELEIPALVDG